MRFQPPPAVGPPESKTLTSESARLASRQSRRVMLAGLASCRPLLAAAAEPDAIFSLIEVHRAALPSWMAALVQQSRLERAGDWAAADEVAEKPCHDANDAFEHCWLSLRPGRD